MKSSKKSAWLRGAMLAAVCAVGFGNNVTTLRASAQATAAVTIGVVDEDKLADGYTKYQDIIKSLGKRSQDIGDQLAARALLSADEGKNFEALVLQPTLTQADNDKVAAFVKTANDRNAEYIALNGKVTKVDADNARIKELRDLANNNSDAVNTLSDKLYGNLKKQQDDTDKQYTDQAKQIIIQVANEKKFTMVVRSRGVIWNVPSIDITDEVLKRLNR